MSKLYINPNILDEGNQMELLYDNEDVMKRIVRCNNCGQPTEYGKTRMCSGFVGCDNKININGKKVECYFEDIIAHIDKFELGTKIRSERGDIYNLSQAEGEGKQRKFSRWNGTRLRFMTYENIRKKFEILEDNTEEIEEIDEDEARHEIFTYTGEGERRSNLYCFSLYTERHIVPKINELVKAVNKMKEGKE